MDGKGEEKVGTGLTDVIRLLLDLPTERLRSLTYQLGETPEEDLVHALSLLLLDKETQGLDRLQALQDDSLANHLAGKWHAAGGKLEGFREQCGHLLDNVEAGEGTPLLLARVFKVLSKERLCEPRLRDLAYSRAVSAYGEKNNGFKVQLLIEEAKDVCGPQIVEKMSTRMRSPSAGEADQDTTALSLTPGKSDGNFSVPCSLKDSLTSSSYPTHLEISLPTSLLTTALVSGQIAPVVSRASRSTPRSLAGDESEDTAPGSDLSSNSSTASLTSSQSTGASATLCGIATSDANSPQDGEKLTATAPSVRSKSPPATPERPPPKSAVPIKTDTGKETVEEEEGAEEEEEETDEVDTFYAFVILHAVEDADMAEAMREKVESICGGGLTGATFSEDFDLPGQSSLGCIEDAIENSAFTLLLLTNRFVRNRRFRVEAEAALIHSIEHRLRYGTVVPLLPRDDGMAKEALPMVLKTLVALEENKHFSRKIKKFLSAKTVRAQRSLWADVQKVKKETRRRERMKEAHERRKLLGDECANTAELQREHLRALMEQSLRLQREWKDFQSVPCGGASPHLWPPLGWPPQQQQQQQQQQQPHSITITNANYVIIGDDSTMTVEHGDTNTTHVVRDDAN